MPIAAAGLVAAGSIGGALIGSNSAKDAAKAQMAMQQNAINFATQQTQPFTNFGQNAVNTLSGIYGWNPTDPNSSPNGGVDWSKYIQTPNYTFAFDQGSRALDASAASKHLLNSGGMVRAAQEFGQGLASQQFGTTVQQLMSMASLGQQSAGQAIGAVTGAYSNMGNAQAQGIMGQANPWVSALNTGPGNALGAYRYFGGTFGSPSPAGSSAIAGNPLALSGSSYTPVMYGNGLGLY